ncbi:hedgehog-interacting protein [Lampetra fluviatilis]
MSVGLAFWVFLVVAVACALAGGRTSSGQPRAQRKCPSGSAPRAWRHRSDATSTVCQNLYKGLSCCTRRSHTYAGKHKLKLLASLNGTACRRFLDELECARCSPDARRLLLQLQPQQEVQSAGRSRAAGRGGSSRAATAATATMPLLCPDYCAEFYGACKPHLAAYLTGAVPGSMEDFCALYSSRSRDGAVTTTAAAAAAATGICFPDFGRRTSGPQGPLSNHLEGVSADSGEAQHPSKKRQREGLCLLLVADRLRQPVGAVPSRDGTQRLFILEREGVVRVLAPRTGISAEPFMDLHKVVQSGNKLLDERGLLSLVFHPGFQRNGKVYVSYTTNRAGGGMGPHDHILRVSEFTLSRKSANRVDPTSERTMVEVAELHRRNLGGELLFGEDGLLYVFLGDGEITLDDMEEMDGLSDFTGSVLRVNVSLELCERPYAIPPDNPYANGTFQPPETFAQGLRSPGRCTVDRHRNGSVDGGGTMLCVERGRGGRQGDSGRLLLIRRDRDYESEPPVFHYRPEHPSPLVGGHVYRGCQSRRLQGLYIFGDHSGRLMSLNRAWQQSQLPLGGEDICHGGLSGRLQGTLIAVAQDETGEMYLLTNSKISGQTHTGRLYKLMDPKRHRSPPECARTLAEPMPLSSKCPRFCGNGRCFSSGKCCCQSGWEGELCNKAKCERACVNGGACVKPNKCLCKSGFQGATCDQAERSLGSAFRAGLSLLFGNPYQKSQALSQLPRSLRRLIRGRGSRHTQGGSRKENRLTRPTDLPKSPITTGYKDLVTEVGRRP